jgi:phenylacetic acid degradation operon negative regulatory protein
VTHRQGAVDYRQTVPTSDASARTLLLTVLGEFVHPRRSPVWTATLLEALGSLGVEEKSARQALTRTANEGLLASARHGRRVLWQLTDGGHDLLEDGTRRIYGFMREPHPWDGRWLVLSVPIPESRRQLRHRLRTRLTWLGLGSPTSGVWVSPDATKVDEVHRVVEELDLADQAFAWVGAATGLGDHSRLLAAAWDLADVEDRYLAFVAAFEPRTVSSQLAAFTSQVDLVSQWRRFPAIDPELPTELLDPTWPGPRAARLFGHRHDGWHRRAQAHWDRIAGAAGSRSV